MFWACVLCIALLKPIGIARITNITFLRYDNVFKLGITDMDGGLD